MFEDTIGVVTCQHHYRKSADPQLYNYVVRWVSKSFEAVLDFQNHTSKGLLSLDLRLIDRETNNPFGPYASKIVDAVNLAKERTRAREQGGAHDCYARVRVRCGIALSGSYHINELEMLLIPTQAGVDLIYPTQFRRSKSELAYRAKKDAIVHVSALTALSQHLFVLSESDEVDLIWPEDFENLLNITEFDGKYVDDTPLCSARGASLGIAAGPDGAANPGEVIMLEDSDFRINGYLCLPSRIGELMQHINSDQGRSQAAKRFHDALRFRGIRSEYSDGDFGVSYELLAYVAAIEALLDHSRVKNELCCDECGATVAVEDYKISEKFRDFVNLHSGGSDAMRNSFKKLYSDRSKFVHTGMELHASNVLRPNRPLILEGGNHVTGVPAYYYNIHEWTGFMLRVNFYLTAYQSSCDSPGE